MSVFTGVKVAPKTINIINVPSDIGSIHAGKSRAPAAFKSAGLHKKLEAEGLRVTESTALLEGSGRWVSSTREPNGARNEAKTVSACHQVQKSVSAALGYKDGKKKTIVFQLILGGECLYCPPIMSAYWQHFEGSNGRLGIIYVDADCHLATPAESDSTGNISGMTLTHLTLREDALESMEAFCRPDGSPVVDCNNIALFGLNMDSPTNKRSHLGYLLDNSFHVTTSRTIQQSPIEEAEAALAWLDDRVDVFLVHLDVGVIDSGQFPLGNVPSYSGLGFEETLAAVQTFLRSSKVIGLSIAEVNPDHDPGLKMTEQLVDKLVVGLAARTKS